MYNTRNTQNVLFMLLIGKASGQQQAISSYVFEESQVICGAVTVGIGGVSASLIPMVVKVGCTVEF